MAIYAEYGVHVLVNGGELMYVEERLRFGKTGRWTLVPPIVFAVFWLCLATPVFNACVFAVNCLLANSYSSSLKGLTDLQSGASERFGSAHQWAGAAVDHRRGHSRTSNCLPDPVLLPACWTPIECGIRHLQSLVAHSSLHCRLCSAEDEQVRFHRRSGQRMATERSSERSRS